MIIKGNICNQEHQNSQMEESKGNTIQKKMAIPRPKPGTTAMVLTKLVPAFPIQLVGNRRAKPASIKVYCFLDIAI